MPAFDAVGAFRIAQRSFELACHAGKDSDEKRIKRDAIAVVAAIQMLEDRAKLEREIEELKESLRIARKRPVAETSCPSCSKPVSCALTVQPHDDAALAALLEISGQDRFIAAAWVLDRADQYDPPDRVRAALDEIMTGLATGAHLAAYRHGELDQLIEDTPFIRLERARGIYPLFRFNFETKTASTEDPKWAMVTESGSENVCVRVGKETVNIPASAIAHQLIGTNKWVASKIR